jgi:hypothetical protein
LSIRTKFMADIQHEEPPVDFALVKQKGFYGGQLVTTY